MRKLLALLLVAAMLFALSACTPKEDPLLTVSEKIALITDYGMVMDGGMNQSVWEAVQVFAEKCKTEASSYETQTDDTTGRIAAMEQAIAEGHTVLALPGFSFGGAIAEISGKHPEVKFIGLDVDKGALLEAGVSLKGESYDYNPDNWELKDYVHMDNVYCAVYREEVAGFMAGYSAVKLGYTKLGFYGVIHIPDIMLCGYGYIQGADAAAKELGITVELDCAYDSVCSCGDPIEPEATAAFLNQWHREGRNVTLACGGAEIMVLAGEDAQEKAVSYRLSDHESTQIQVLSESFADYAATVEYALMEILVGKDGKNLMGTVERVGLHEGYNHVNIDGLLRFEEGKFT